LERSRAPFSTFHHQQQQQHQHQHLLCAVATTTYKPDNMQAIQYTDNCPNSTDFASALKLVEVPKPEASPGNVVVAVQATR
jgi:hypothetical protein